MPKPSDSDRPTRIMGSEEVYTLRAKLTILECETLEAAIIGEAICPRRVYIDLTDEVKAIFRRHHVPLSNPTDLPKR